MEGVRDGEARTEGREVLYSDCELFNTELLVKVELEEVMKLRATVLGLAADSSRPTNAELPLADRSIMI
jgi:hypothetical protein